MTASKRRHHHGQRRGPRPVPRIVADSEHLAGLDRSAAMIRNYLQRRGADFVPVAELAADLHLSLASVRATVNRYPDLGIGGLRDRPVLWSISPAATVAGFEPVFMRGRVVLRLGITGGPPWPLVISGEHLGAAHQTELDPDELGDYGHGELGYTICRLTMMARRWLIMPDAPNTDEAVAIRLFEIIARAWQSSPGPAWFVGRLHAHQADLELPIGTQFWERDTKTSRLELVIWADRNDGFVLVNVYPAGTYGAIFGAEGS